LAAKGEGKKRKKAERKRKEKGRKRKKREGRKALRPWLPVAKPNLKFAIYFGALPNLDGPLSRWP